jgi:hypothetical protein
MGEQRSESEGEVHRPAFRMAVVKLVVKKHSRNGRAECLVSQAIKYRLVPRGVRKSKTCGRCLKEPLTARQIYLVVD